MEESKIPVAYQTVMPYLIVEGAEKFLVFLKQIFNASEQLRVPGSEGGIRHAEVKIGDSTVMVADATEKFKPTPAGLFINVADTDKTYKHALREGATSIMEPFDEDYGARSAGIRDPFGNTWWLATYK